MNLIRETKLFCLYSGILMRAHKVTLLKIKHIRLKERYGEGEIPHEAKTGTGPILLTCSFPYVRDWLNEHPFKNDLMLDSVDKVMKQLRKRIIRLLKSDEIKTVDEREKLEYVLNTKRWNPYCIRHSAITADSDYLPEYALKKKVRWSMNSKQGTRYIKRRMGNDLKQKILCYNGIVPEEALRPAPSVMECPRCQFINETENRFCSKCSYPLVPAAFEEIKANEQTTINELKVKYEDDMNKIKQVIASLVTSVGNCNKSQKQEIAEQLIRSGFYNTMDRLKSSRKDDDSDTNLLHDYGQSLER